MPREFERRRRVAAQIQRDLAEVVRQEVRDPRLAAVTFSGVEVTRDLSVAKVYVGALAGAARQTPGNPGEVLVALRQAAGFLRHALAGRLQARTVPELRFHWDEALERGSRISALIDAAVQEDSQRPDAEGGDPDAGGRQASDDDG